MIGSRTLVTYIALVVSMAALLSSPHILMPQRALAHANLARAEPAPNSVWEKPPGRVTIWFTEPIEARFSDIQVLDAQGQRVDNGDSLVDKNDPTALSVTLRPLPNGTYTVAWNSVSSVDGHSVRGSYLFSVGEPVTGAPSAVTPGQPLVSSPAEPVLRWLLLLSIMTVVGGLGFELLVWRPVLAGRGASRALRSAADRLASRALTLASVAVAVFLMASVVQLLVQAAGAYDVPLYKAIGAPAASILTGTDWGGLWLWRVGLMGVAAFCLGIGYTVPARGSGSDRVVEVPRRTFRAIALAPALGVLLTLSLTSHGAATSGIRLEAVSTDYLHLLAAGFWVGGLFHFAFGMPLLMKSLSAREQANVLSSIVPRFSVTVVISVTTLIVTGIYSAWAQVTVIPALTTPYGLTLLAKVALIMPLLLFGALNFLWVSPQLAKNRKAVQWLRRFVTIEAVLAALVLLSVGLLTSLEPARQVASRDGLGQPKDLTFKDTVEGTNIALTIDPGRLGPNLLIVALTDRLGRSITNASQVTLQLTYLDQDLGASQIVAVDHGGGFWVAHGAVLSIAGNYAAAVTVRRPDAFDARTTFRFRVAPGAGSSTISPAPNTGKLLWVVELLLLGFLFLAVGLAAGGWWKRGGPAGRHR